MTFLPPIGKATAKEIAAWQREMCDSTKLPERWSMVREWELNRLYVLENQQWLEEAAQFSQTADGYQVNPFLKNLQSEELWQCMPTQNEMLPITQNEIARLVSGKTDFVVNRSERSTTVDRAARLAERVLRADNIAKNWRGMEFLFARDMTVFGTGLIRTAQDMDFINTMKKPVDLMACPGCRWRAVKSELETVKDMPVLTGQAAVKLARFGARPMNFSMENYGGEDRMELHQGTEETEPKAFLDRCPECGSGLTERPATADEDEDFDGNPTTDVVPTYDAGMEIVSPYDFFPHGNGRLDPDGMVRLWTIERIVSLDWLAAHFRDGSKVNPAESEDDLMSIARWHPAGNEDGSFGTMSGNDGRRLEGFTVMRETVRDPYFDLEEEGDDFDAKKLFENGRWSITAGDRTLVDTELMMEDERGDEKIPRAMMHWAAWEPRKGSMWGKPHATYLRSIQDNINTALGQAMEMRHLHGNPKVILGPTSSLEYAGQMFGGYQNSMWRYQGEAPVFQEGKALNEAWKFEMTQNVEAVQRVGSARAVESGGAPGAGITAYTALQLLSDNAAVTRQPRIDGKKVAVAAMHRHRLQLMGVLFVDERQFRAGDRGDHQAFEAFRGIDLCGQYDVEILSTPFVETPVIRREAAVEGLKNGTIVLRTAGDRQRFNEATGAPNDIAPGDGIQIDRAKREWLALVQVRDTEDGGEKRYDLKYAPVVKWRVDEDLVHADEHLESLNSWEGEEMRKNWDPLEIELAGWRDTFQQIKMAEVQLKTDPPDPSGPKESLLVPGPDGRIATAAIKAAGEEWKQKRDMQAKIDALPKLPELRIYDLWMKMLVKAGFQVAGPQILDEATGLPVTPDFDRKILGQADLALLRWLAHIEGHYENHEAKQALNAPPAPGSAAGAPGQAAAASSMSPQAQA